MSLEGAASFCSAFSKTAVYTELKTEDEICY